jgi:GldM C-terminal domain
MGRLCTLIFFFLVANAAHAQVQLVNASLTKPDSAILFLGVENKLLLSGIKWNSSINCTSSKCAIDTYTGHIIAKPDLTGLDTLRIFDAKSKVFEKVFRIDTLPNPTMLIAGSADTFLYKEAFAGVPNIAIVYTNCLFKSKARVTEFEMTIVKKDKSIYRIYTRGYLFCEEALSKMQLLKRGDKIFFDSITFASGQGSNCPRTWSARTITIK